MDNLGTLATLGTQYSDRQTKHKYTTQITKMISNTDPNKKQGCEPRRSRWVSSSCLLSAINNLIITIDVIYSGGSSLVI